MTVREDEHRQRQGCRQETPCRVKPSAPQRHRKTPTTNATATAEDEDARDQPHGPRPAVGTKRTIALDRFNWAIAATRIIIEIAAELLPTVAASYFRAATAQ